MDKCKTCKHWSISEHEILEVGGYLDERFNEDIRTDAQVRKKMGFNIKICRHPKVVCNRNQSIERDSVILKYDPYDYQSYMHFFTCESYGCVNHEKKRMEHL